MKCYHVYLPIIYNDGKEIEPEKLDNITEKIEKRFKGCSIYPKVKPPIVQGIWIERETQKRFEDKIVMVEIIVEDTEKNYKWFKKLKNKIIEELKQKEIFIVSYNVDII